MGWATGVQLQEREVIIPFITVPKPALVSKQSSIQWRLKKSSTQIQWLDSKDDKSAQLKTQLPYFHFPYTFTSLC